MILASVSMVACLVCFVCIVMKCSRRSRKNGAGFEESGRDEDSADDQAGDGKCQTDATGARTGKVGGQEYSSAYKGGIDAKASGPRADQAFRGSSQETKRLLTPEEDEVKGTAPPPVGDSALRAEAAREVERILAAPNQLAVLGGGAKKERTARFRQLARMLHPDKGLVEGDRASLALRRVVEAHRATASQD